MFFSNLIIKKDIIIEWFIFFFMLISLSAGHLYSGG